MTRPQAPPRTPLGVVVGWLGANVTPEVVAGPPDPAITGLTLNSRAVQPGDLFVAPAGSRAHGATFAPQAVGAGAVAVLTDPAGLALCAGLEVPVLVVEHPRRVVGDLAARLYGEPARSLRLIAVTGTQGKTTITRLAQGALETAGIPAAVVGTVGTRIDGEEVRTALTTPEAPELHALFAVMRERGVLGCAMEVSSHALVMGRVDGVVFDVAAFINLGRDHLDFHADEEEYFQAKASLFTPERARLGLVNVDDPYGRRLADAPAVPTRTFSTAGATADWTAGEIVPGPDGSAFTLRGPGVELRTRVPMAGGFNVANAVCALAALGEAGFDLPPLAEALGSAPGVPGRLERVDAGQDFLAVVDYAHKPDAVAAVLTSLREQTAGRLLLVLGAGGDRDPGKRPLMGEVAARLADIVVVTDDNPRGEEPAAIRAEVLAGARGGAAEVIEVGDRREAIGVAAARARRGDTVVVAGKGHETGQDVGGTVHPFDDRTVLREAIAELREAP